MQRKNIIGYLLLTLALAQLACFAPVAIPLTGSGATPTPVTPGNPFLTPTIPTGPCTNKVTFVSDVTIPDNSRMEKGQAFTKTWRVKNDGDCTWGPSGHPLSALVYTGGDKMGGPDLAPLPGEVKPGETADVSVQLTAPTTPGTYVGQWKFQVTNEAGEKQTLGVGNEGKGALFVQIIVN